MGIWFWVSGPSVFASVFFLFFFINLRYCRRIVQNIRYPVMSHLHRTASMPLYVCMSFLLLIKWLSRVRIVCVGTRLMIIWTTRGLIELMVSRTSHPHDTKCPCGATTKKSWTSLGTTFLPPTYYTLSLLVRMTSGVGSRISCVWQYPELGLAGRRGRNMGEPLPMQVLRGPENLMSRRIPSDMEW